jgi:GxxExxY protein
MVPPLDASHLNQITSTIIAKAIAIHRELGPGLLENAYLCCLCYELHLAGLHLEMQKPIPLTYRGVTIDCAYRADIVVENAVIAEVKALESLAPIHSRQLCTYLKLANSPVGLILNFGAQTMKAGITRVVNGFPHEGVGPFGGPP